jgi:uncharacterized protein YqgV (UPF0045/DUF77 family)
MTSEQREHTVNITVDISMYPLDANYLQPIKDFIRSLRAHDGLQIVTNQLSTQICGDFQQVTAALNECMRESMASEPKVVFVTRYLNAALDIGSVPQID